MRERESEKEKWRGRNTKVCSVLNIIRLYAYDYIFNHFTSLTIMVKKP